MIKLGQRNIRISDFHSVLYADGKIEIDTEALEKVSGAFRFLQEFCKGKVIYGINTGFGPMAPYRINQKHQRELQYNLIRSHSSGMGQVLSSTQIKSVLLARLNTLLLGKSGIHPDVLVLFKNIINKDICPLIYEHGGVGASGDLVQLAHVALGLLGEGKCRYKGQIMNTGEVFAIEGLHPMEIHIREGLGIMNGTAAMTGIGIINSLAAARLYEYSVAASCMLNELVKSYGDHFSAELNNTKLHPGQRHTADLMRQFLSDSKRIRQRQEHLYDMTESESEVLEDRVQEYYSLRCVPQILGPIYDTLTFCTEVLENEVNSANDNPVIDENVHNVFHGGNFHGDYVALEMDKLRIALTKLSMLAERQLNFLMNHKLNGILPPFANLGRLGLNFGMQGIQFTAVSTTAENQTLSGPMYIHSIPNNNDNQDIVSMGANSALLTSKVADNCFQVLAVELASIAQAVDYLGCLEDMSTSSKALYTRIRNVFPAVHGDQPAFEKLQDLADELKRTI